MLDEHSAARGNEGKQKGIRSRFHRSHALKGHIVSLVPLSSLIRVGLHKPFNLYDFGHPRTLAAAALAVLRLPMRS